MRKLRLGVIGAGSWAVASHLPNFARHADAVEFWVVNRPDEGSLRPIAERFGFRHATTRWEDVVAEGPDLLLVSSPAAFHAEQARAGLEAGAHVLCEKPFTLRASDAWALTRLAEARGRHLVIAFGWNYRPLVVRAAELMREDGGIGPVEHLSVVMASATRELLSGRGAYEASATEVPPCPDTWTDPRLSGGGYGQAQLSHALGIALWLTGLRATEAFAYTSGPGGEAVELHDAIVLRFGGGAIGTVSGASSHRGAGGGKHQVDVRAIGATGQLHLDLERERLWRYRGPGDDVSEDLGPHAGEYDCVGPVDALVELAQGRGTNRSPAELGARTVEVLEAAYRSAEAGDPVPIAWEGS